MFKRVENSYCTMGIHFYRCIYGQLLGFYQKKIRNQGTFFTLDLWSETIALLQQVIHVTKVDA